MTKRVHLRILIASALVIGLIAGAAAAAAAGTGTPGSNGLPSVSSGHRPGPDILYAKPALAPQLENTGVWDAPPILVSGAQAYRDGEWLYQDYLLDDHGATGTTRQRVSIPVGVPPPVEPSLPRAR